MSETTRAPAGPGRFKKITPKAVTLSGESLVRSETLPGGGPLPLVLRPGAEGVDLVEWAATHGAFVEGRLLEHGALLFREALQRLAGDVRGLQGVDSNDRRFPCASDSYFATRGARRDPAPINRYPEPPILLHRPR